MIKITFNSIKWESVTSFKHVGKFLFLVPEVVLPGLLHLQDKPLGFCLISHTLEISTHIVFDLVL